VDHDAGWQPDPLDATDVPSVPPQRRSRRVVVVGSVVLVLALATILGVTLSIGGPAVPGAGMTPTAFVLSATHTTLAHRTADLVITGSVTKSGTSVAIRGTGQADLAAGAMTANLTADGPGESLIERELVTDGHFYMGMTINGTSVSTITGGKHWIELPLPINGSTSSLGSGTVDPFNQLQLLAKRGNTIRPLGTSVIGGVAVVGFAITPSRQTMDQDIQNEIASEHLSAAAQKQLEQGSHLFSSFTMDVWFDASGLLRRMGADIDTTSTSTGKFIMTFDNYGTPVNISPPVPGDVISYSAFATAVQAEEATQK
jgi:hypothetical protein